MACWKFLFGSLLAGASALFACPQFAPGQTVGGAVGGGAIGGGAIGGGTVGGTVAGGVAGGAAAGGIVIDAQGVVTPVYSKAGASKLARKRMQATAQEHLPADVNRTSPLRKISLVRLEEECAEYAKKEQPAPAEMQFLAGLQRLDYVFVYPETGDVVIAGPAEGFAADGVGRVVGLESGRPPLRLDDLIVALRALERSGRIGCSIDPVPERLAALQRYVAQNSGPSTVRVAERRYVQMRKILGMQDVSVTGVPAESHFAEVMVEADFRMKQISLGLEKPGVRGLRSHLSMLGLGGNSMQRWWLAPLYDAFTTTDDGNAYAFSGQRVQLMSQEELADAAGRRSDAPFTRVTTQRYAALFTEKFPELAERSAVFAELQNLFDLAVMAALLKKERIPERIGWDPDVFLDPRQTIVERGRAPRQVPTMVNYRRVRGGAIVGLIGGGVQIDPFRTAQRLEMKADQDNRLGAIRDRHAQQQDSDQHRWWWD